MLEFHNIKTVQTATMGVAVAQNAMKDRLKNSSLSNKQKAEVLLVAEMEAYRVVNGLINSIEEHSKMVGTLELATLLIGKKNK